jgi:hypothetical protein
MIFGERVAGARLKMALEFDRAAFLNEFDEQSSRRRDAVVT